jgi:hypothetical protein
LPTNFADPAAVDVASSDRVWQRELDAIWSMNKAVNFCNIGPMKALTWRGPKPVCPDDLAAAA